MHFCVNKLLNFRLSRFIYMILFRYFNATGTLPCKPMKAQARTSTGIQWEQDWIKSMWP